MKAALLSVGFAGLAAANINFNWVQPTCHFNDLEDNSCLRGQVCSENDTYVSCRVFLWRA